MTTGCHAERTGPRAAFFSLDAVRERSAFLTPQRLSEIDLRLIFPSLSLHENMVSCRVPRVVNRNKEQQHGCASDRESSRTKKPGAGKPRRDHRRVSQRRQYGVPEPILKLGLV